MNDEKDLKDGQVKSNISADDQYQAKGFWNSIKQFFINLFKDIRASFIYNPMKLSAILVGIPGFLLGFFIVNHYNVLTKLIFPDQNSPFYGQYASLEFGNFAAMLFFFLMLIGFLNIFTAFSLSGKKNLGSVVMSTVLSVAMLAIVCVYLYLIFQSIAYQDACGQVVTMNENFSDLVMVLVSTVASVICSVAGSIIGFFRYDRTYKKSDIK